MLVSQVGFGSCDLGTLGGDFLFGLMDGGKPGFVEGLKLSVDLASELL